MKDKTPTQTIEARPTPTGYNRLFRAATYALISAIVFYDFIRIIYVRILPRNQVEDAYGSLDLGENKSRETKPSGSSCDESSGNFNSVEFDWDKVTPSPTLQWVTCYDEKQCARLEVPLDYNNVKDVEAHGEKASIAILRIPAKVDSNDPRYKGPVLFNFGGPGAPGVQSIQDRGAQFQVILGDEYDIVGFDPRGLGYTRPLIDVFDTPLERASWDLRNSDAPLSNETRTAVVQIAARSKLINDLVLEKVESAARHVNTVVVARDMLSVIHAYGYDKLQYWGFSYGSVLGATFAALFPDNVGRLVIDGVLDSEKYYEGTYIDSIRNVDKGFDLVFEQCSESGSECALHEITAKKVKERYFRLVSKLDEEPVTVRVKKTGAIGIIKRSQVHRVFLVCIYKPYAVMKEFFTALRALEDRDGLPIWEFFQKFQPSQLPMLTCDCKAKPPLPVGGAESGTAVMCTDGGPMNGDPETLHRHISQLANISYFGDVWSEVRMRCIEHSGGITLCRTNALCWPMTLSGWKIKPAWKWTGPIRGNTSFPLLIIGNTLDPVTPDAELVSKWFPNSALLTQNSAGHCSISAVSTCTGMTIRNYFREGIIPKKGTVCEIEDHMFLNHTTIFASDKMKGVEEEAEPERLEEQDNMELERSGDQRVDVGSVKVLHALRALKALHSRDRVGGPFTVT